MFSSSGSSRQTRFVVPHSGHTLYPPCNSIPLKSYKHRLHNPRRARRSASAARYPAIDTGRNAPSANNANGTRHRDCAVPALLHADPQCN